MTLINVQHRWSLDQFGEHDGPPRYVEGIQGAPYGQSVEGAGGRYRSAACLPGRQAIGPSIECAQRIT